MKKYFVIVLLTCFVIGCASNDTEKSTAETKVADPTENPDYAKGLDLIAKSDCLTCHKVSEKLIGPPYEAVAAKYTFTPDVIDTLAETIIKGSVGKWGQIPMTSHPSMSKEDATAMVKYIMTLKK